MVKIVVDSGCDLTENMKNKIDINLEQVPLHLQLGDKQFIDDYNLDVGDFIDEMDSYQGAVKTAAPSPDAYMEKYSGDESVFAITLSSKLSGSFNSATLAKRMYLSDIGEKFIHVFDSLSASVCEMLIALKINELAKIHLPDQQIADKVGNFVSEMRTFFILEKYDNLVKTGRLNPYIAKIASLLSINPICGASNGEISLLGKARGYKKAATKLVDMIVESNVDFENRVLGISHVKCLEKALLLKEEICARVKFKDIIIVESGGLCSVYAQRNGIIVSF